jgi:hypothetical protein
VHSRTDERRHADGEVVWSWRPDAGVKVARQMKPAADRGKKAGPWGEHEVNRKTSRREGRMFGSYLW